MKLLLLVAAAIAVLAAPLGVAALVAVTMTPGATASCGIAAPVGGRVVQVPDTLSATTRDGTGVRLDRAQLTHAATIITIGAGIDGVGRQGVLVALMAALTESRLLMYANTGAYPDSARYPHDADGSDHDSLGIFQMRPAAGWGTVTELMDPTYQARAFFGGPTGPNDGSPRGLLDITDWASLPMGAAAQAVEVSAHPDRYATWEPVAEAILTTLTTPPATPGPSSTAAPSTVPSSTAEGTASSAAGAALPTVTRTVFPLPTGTWTRSSSYGMRLNPVLQVWQVHTGVDLAAPSGTPVLATAAGRVAFASYRPGRGNQIVLEHLVGGQVVASSYGHLRDGGIHVTTGDVVAAGQQIGDVGSTGNSTGPHLHFEIRSGGADHVGVNPDNWLSSAAEVASADIGAPGRCPVVPS
ncbi:M23 family metallopeptidase [Georgenia yuyongxinii]